MKSNKIYITISRKKVEMELQFNNYQFCVYCYEQENIDFSGIVGHGIIDNGIILMYLDYQGFVFMEEEILEKVKKIIKIK